MQTYMQAPKFLRETSVCKHSREMIIHPNDVMWIFCFLPRGVCVYVCVLWPVLILCIACVCICLVSRHVSLSLIRHRDKKTRTSTPVKTLIRSLLLEVLGFVCLWRGGAAL